MRMYAVSDWCYLVLNGRLSNLVIKKTWINIMNSSLRKTTPLWNTFSALFQKTKYILMTALIVSFLYLNIMLIFGRWQPHRWCNGYRASRFRCGRLCVWAPGWSNQQLWNWYFPQHSTLKSKNKNWLARNQDNISGCSDMSTRGLVFQWADTIKMQLSVLV